MRRTYGWLSLVAWVLLCFAAGGIGGLAMRGESFGWYRQPVWAPPNWVFGPVWTVLYCAMGVAAWLVFRSGGPGASKALRFFGLQLVLNALWPWVFFGARNPGAAFVVIAMLWLTIAVTTGAFWRVRRAAGLLMLPYLAWASFAAALNLAIFDLMV